MTQALTPFDTPLPGCCELVPKIRSDDRGRFVKVFNHAAFCELGIDFTPAECFHSTSRRGVVRGLHFQVPPAEHGKLVTCLAGSAQDVAVDLRRGSPTFGRHHAIILDHERGNAYWLPAGFAHGFAALTDDCCLLYLVGSGHSPSHDAGIRWDSCGINWEVADPLVSPRDAALPALADFQTPFIWNH